MKKALIKRLLLLAILISILFVLHSSFAQAETRTATSCSASDVQVAMDNAAAGDTVVIPACSGGVSWDTPVSWNAPSNVTLMGAGTSATGGGDQTVIIDNYATNSPLLLINVASTGVFRMTGITFEGGVSGSLKYNGVLVINGPGTIRIDHCHFDTRGYPQPFVARAQKIPVIGNGVYGVMDHCTLDLYGASAPYIYNGAGSDGRGNYTWTQPTAFGGGDFFFIEDNQFNGYCTSETTCETRVSDGWSAAREVVRFNNLSACSGPEQHATGHASDDRGFRAIEVYGNLSTATSESLSSSNGPNYDMASVQNGGALIWGNSAMGCYKNGVIFKVTRKDNATYSQAATPYGWGYCGTDFNGTGSAWDGNTNEGTGYPCIDQPGRGPGDLLTGLFSNGSKVNSRTGTITWPNQALEPIYLWNNDVSLVSGWGGTQISNKSCTPSVCRLTANVDYYPQASGIQTSPTSPFDGTYGTGWGTLANRPKTCTFGVAYFATDQGSWNTSSSNPYGVQQNGADGVLYKCTAPNTWTLYYVPYTYPHPLRQEQDLSLTAPTNLRIEDTGQSY